MNQLQTIIERLRAARKPTLDRASRRGMSLVEIMVVIAIILTLMSVVGYGVMSVWESAKVDTTKLSMGDIAKKVQIYQVRNNKAPTTSEGLAAVYLGEEPPKDGWGNDFVYLSPGPNGLDFDVVSYGRDGTDGGDGLAADIRLSEIK